MILCGLLRDGRYCYDRLGETGLTTGDFYEDVHERAFDLFSYVCQSVKGPVLADVYEESLRRRKRPLDGAFESHKTFVLWLVDLWFLPMWLADGPGKDGRRKGMFFWANPSDEKAPQHTWATLAAAAKVRHLAARRAMVHAALETLRDAADPAGDADELYRRAKDLGEY